MPHPIIAIELASGTPSVPRARTLADITVLPHACQDSLTEVRELIERERLSDLGAAWCI